MRRQSHRLHQADVRCGGISWAVPPLTSGRRQGCDYLFTADYIQEREYARQALVELAEAYPKLKFALEYKPKGAPTHSYMARLGIPPFGLEYRL